MALCAPLNRGPITTDRAQRALYARRAAASLRGRAIKETGDPGSEAFMLPIHSVQHAAIFAFTIVRLYAAVFQQEPRLGPAPPHT